jgi:hypothetical protein
MREILSDLNQKGYHSSHSSLGHKNTIGTEKRGKMEEKERDRGPKISELT